MVLVMHFFGGDAEYGKKVFCYFYNRTDAADVLLDTFGNSCSTASSWTKASIEQTHSLIGAMEALQRTDPCQRYTGTLNLIQAMSRQITNLIKDQSYSSYRLAEEKLQELTLTLNDASDPTYKTKLSTEVLDAQISLASARASYNTSQDALARDWFAQGTEVLSQLVSGILRETTGLGTCLKQSPAASVQLATTFIALGGSFVSPIYGTALSVVGQLLNTGIDYFRNMPLTDAIQSFQSAKMPLALSCSLESMTELYCQANDAITLLQLQRDLHPPKDLPENNVLRALDLLARRIPVVLDWLALVRSGGSARDSYDAERRNQILDKLGRLLPVQNTIDGRINDAELLSSTYPDSLARQKAIIRLAADISVLLTGGPVSSFSGPAGRIAISIDPGPFVDLSRDPFDYACYLMSGYPNSSCPQKPIGAGIDSSGNIFPVEVENYIIANPSLASGADFQNLERNWAVVLDTVSRITFNAFAKVVNLDPRLHLAKAFEDSTDNYSPRDVFAQIKKYLRSFSVELKNDNPQLRTTVEETLQIVNETISIIDDPREQIEDPQNPSRLIDYTPGDKLAKIAALFRLQTGTQFFSERINQFVEADLRRQLIQGDPPGSTEKQVSEILRSAGGEIRLRLVAAGVRENQKLLESLNASRRLIADNITNFRKYFDPELVRAVERLAEGAKSEAPRGLDRPFGQDLARLCVLTLATGEKWPSDAAQKACSGAVLESLYANSNPKVSIEVDKLELDLSTKNAQYRMCAYQRFLRANRLIELSGLGPILPGM
jgi:hypothetical protein